MLIYLVKIIKPKFCDNKKECWDNKMMPMPMMVFATMPMMLFITMLREAGWLGCRSLTAACPASLRLPLPLPLPLASHPSSFATGFLRNKLHHFPEYPSLLLLPSFSGGAASSSSSFLCAARGGVPLLNFSFWRWSNQLSSPCLACSSLIVGGRVSVFKGSVWL